MTVSLICRRYGQGLSLRDGIGENVSLLSKGEVRYHHEQGALFSL
jgi:hypothetical protein